MSLIRKIKDYYKNSKSVLFTTPSHSQGNFIPSTAKDMLGEKFYECDFSEIDGFDNLRAPNGILKKLQDKIANIYDAKSSFMLTNGSTSGIIAAMLATLKEKDNVLIARNCHISVYNGLVLTGANPIWFLPDYDEKWGIFKGITADIVKKYLDKNNNIKALIITSPTYEGVFSDINEIAEICKEKGIVLIVDEAHGAILNFSKYKNKSALQQNADIVIHSLHKTAGAPNPCALIHISKNSKISPNKVQAALNLINTTSPSYALLTAIEASVLYLESAKGRKHINKLLEEIESFIKKLPKDIEIYNNDNDITKILIKSKSINAERFSEVLNTQYNIEEEYTNKKSMLFITGIGTDKTKLNKLNKAIKNISQTTDIQEPEKNDNILQIDVPQALYTPREAFFLAKEITSKANAIGKISGETIMQYPPGIPILLPGETISKEIANEIENLEILTI